MQLQGIMVTNGGPHPADKWAEITAEQIVDTILVDSNLDNVTPEAQAARKAKRALRNRLFDIFEGHHDRVQRAEQADNAKIKTVSAAAARASHVDTPLDPSEHVDGILDQVRQAFSQTPWADHLAKPEVLQVVAHIIGQHTADVMHIERRWHHDRLAAKES